MKIGIVVDDYKIDKFIAALKEKELTELKQDKFLKNTTLITVFITTDQQKEVIRRICVKLEITKGRSN